MIITRTPFRISFFGGGTDYPVWFRDNGGQVLSSSIDKYCYITARHLPPFFENKSRIVWSKIELVNNISEIQHPAIRGILDHLDLNDGIEIHHAGDLPSRSGIGSSSSFTVGLLNALHSIKGNPLGQKDLATAAIHIEQNILNENVGSQDQIAAALGGFNKLIFNKDGSFEAIPIDINDSYIKELQDHLALFFTGLSRNASEIAEEQIRETPKKRQELEAMHKLVDEAMLILEKKSDVREFGKLLDKTWKIKRSLTKSISNKHIDDMYERGIAAGAIGGKLLGAGGGGFMLFFVEPEKRHKLIEEFKDLVHVPFSFEAEGSTIIHNKELK